LKGFQAFFGLVLRKGDEGEELFAFFKRKAKRGRKTDDLFQVGRAELTSEPWSITTHALSRG